MCGKSNGPEKGVSTEGARVSGVESVKTSAEFGIDGIEWQSEGGVVTPCSLED